MKSVIVVLLIFGFSTTTKSQTQNYFSMSNVISAQGLPKIDDIESSDIKRIAIVPVERHPNERALVIGPEKGLDGTFGIHLKRKTKTVDDRNNKIIYYEGLENGENRVVIFTIHNKILVSIGIETKLGKQYVFTWTFKNLRPEFNEWNYKE